jgi:hypothetical protein
MAGSQDLIACSWRLGWRNSAGAMSTDGRTVWSCGHVIGYTDESGVKVAYNCRASVTTARHANGLKKVAHVVESPCRSCLAEHREEGRR